jgi:thioredoxin reductase (NADPH)
MAIENVVVIGTGCAGLTAAIYTARASLRPLVIEGHLSGGQLSTTTDVENFPGFPDGINGAILIENLRNQALKFGARIHDGYVTDIDTGTRPFHVTIDNTYEIMSWAVIIATGATPRYLGLASERELLGHGLSSCATCDGAFFKDQDVIVVGGGDTALEDAIFLTRFAQKVTIVHRRNELRASKIMQGRAFKNDKIDFYWNTVITDIMDPAQKMVTGAKIRNVITNTEDTIECQGVFVAIGHKPNTGIFRNKLELNEAGYICVQYPSARTSVPGIFACGDCVDNIYRQAITAAGTGCAAAIDAERFLSTQATSIVEPIKVLQ